MTKFENLRRICVINPTTYFPKVKENLTAKDKAVVDAFVQSIDPEDIYTNLCIAPRVDGNGKQVFETPEGMWYESNFYFLTNNGMFYELLRLLDGLKCYGFSLVPALEDINVIPNKAGNPTCCERNIARRTFDRIFDEEMVIEENS